MLGLQVCVVLIYRFLSAFRSDCSVLSGCFRNKGVHKQPTESSSHPAPAHKNHFLHFPFPLALLSFLFSFSHFLLFVILCMVVVYIVPFTSLSHTMPYDVLVGPPPPKSSQLSNSIYGINDQLSVTPCITP